MVLHRFGCVVFAPRAGLVRGLRRSLLHGVLHQAPPARSPQTARALDHRQHGPGARLWGMHAVETSMRGGATR